MDNPLINLPSDATEPDFIRLFPGGIADKWRYRDQQGRGLFWIVRLDHGERKEFLPLSWNGQTWMMRLPPPPRPLFGLETLGNAKKVLLVEGEKSACAARRIIGDTNLPVLTWPNGAAAIKQVDISPLQGRDIALWPDADTPGKQAMQAMAKRLQDIDCSVSVITPPPNLMPGWDLADAEQEGWNKERLFSWIKSHKADYNQSGHECLELPPQKEKALLPAPVPFEGTTLQALNPALLPEQLRRFAVELSEALQVPADFTVTGVIAAIAAAERGKYQVQVRDGYVEPLNLYIMAPMEPSARKSPVITCLKKPFYGWQQQKCKEEAPQIEAIASQRRTLESAIKSKRNRAGNLSGDALDSLIQEIIDHEANLPEVPHPTRFFLDDATPEAAAVALSNAGGKLAIMEAEGGILETIGGRYSNGIPNLDLFLKAYSREPVQIDRKGSPPINLAAPQMTILLAPQPGCLQDRKAGSAFRSRGLDARFLYCLPPSLAGQRKIETVPVSDTTKRAYEDTIRRILDAAPALNEKGQSVPHNLHLSPEAYTAWKDFAEEVECSLASTGELVDMRDWGGKLSGQVVRIAGCLHLASHDQPEQVLVSEATMRATTALCAVLVEHAKVAYDRMGERADVACAKRILAWVQARERDHFTARDALEGVKGRYPTMEEVYAGLNVLIDRFLIIPVESDPTPRRGRPPSPAFIINPAG